MYHKKRNVIIPAVHVLLFRGDHVFLIRRFNTGYLDGSYSVVAGHVDSREPVLSAARREAEEEAGLKISASALRMVHVMNRHTPGETLERVDFFVQASVWDGEPRILEPDKCDEMRWFPTRDLPHNLIPYIGFAILQTLAGVYYSEFGW